MCGIAGYVGCFPDPVSGAAILRRMSGALAHRGPDDDGVFAVPGAGLGHRRLALVGVSDGQQPMQSADGALTVAFNGEIFNYVELRADLESRGYRFRTGSDTEVLLHLYEERGPGLVEALNGDFAFALWDARRKRMLLARDRMGVRPLYLARIGDRIFFASEIKALLEVPGIEAQLDPFALDQIFTFWAPVPPRTIFAGIEELPPAHVMIVEDGVQSWRRYWSLDFPDANDPSDTRPEREIVEELSALLEDATKIRLRADVPVGAYLSGGLDSSVICALAARNLPQGLDTFSVTFDSPEHDESEAQELMVEALGTRHSALHCRADDIARVLPAVIRHTERPVVRTAPAPLYLLARLVRGRGIKAVLTGEGADEMLAGYDLFKEAKVRRFCARQPHSRIRPHLFRRLYPYLPGMRRQGAETLAAFFGADLDEVDDPLFSHRPRWRATAGAKVGYSADLRARLSGYDALDEVTSRLPGDFSRWHPLHQAQYLETTLLLPDYILSSQGDRMAMAHGVEGRFPFLDHRLAEFAARIPPSLKLRGLTEKHILRVAASRLLPARIAERTKQPYRAPDSAPFAGPDAPPYVGQALAPAFLLETGLFSPAAVGKLLEKARQGGALGFRDSVGLVGILSTQLWHDTFRRSLRHAPSHLLSAVS